MLQTFLFKNEPLNGILQYFHSNYYNEYHNYITATASNYEKNRLPSYAIDFIFDNFWFCGLDKNVGEYITFSFPQHFVELSGFVVYTTNLSRNSCHPKHFSFSASNDNIHFVHAKNIDDESGEMFNGKGKWKYFGWRHGIFKHYRITITGEAHCGHSIGYRMDLDQVEFFGTIIPNNELRFKTCNIIQIDRITHFILVTIFLFI